MKAVYADDDPILAGYLKSVLEEHGITCLIRNEFLMGGVGDLPVNECWPEIWVLDDRDESRALGLIELALAGAERGQYPWYCPACDERLEPQFQRCWRCGTFRPPEPR